MEGSSRAVSLASRVEHRFNGTAFASAVCLGDVDNDGDNELVVASAEGQISIFKGEKREWVSPSGLGTFTCVIVGDVKNSGFNSIVCVTAEGVCSIYQMRIVRQRSTGVSASTEPTSTPTSVDEVTRQAASQTKEKNALSATAARDHFPEANVVVENDKPCITEVSAHYRQRIPVNTKVLLLTDVDGDGANELVIGKTDRVVLTYRWSDTDECLLPHWTIEFPGQIGSLSSVQTNEGFVLGVSQPENVLMVIDRNGCASHITAGVSNVVSDAGEGLSTQVLGGIQVAHGNAPSMTALCTMSGLLKVGSVESIKWQLQMDRPLFALAKVDVTDDGCEEIIACAWDGYTAIIDHNQNMIRYEFGRELCAFTAGRYAMAAGVNESVFVYVTLYEPESNECVISIHHNLQISQVRATTLLNSTVVDTIAAERETLETFGIDCTSPQTTLKNLLDNGATLHEDVAERIREIEAELALIEAQNQPSSSSPLRLHSPSQSPSSSTSSSLSSSLSDKNFKAALDVASSPQ
eukprot:m.213637 g.213637  ORF g.213637 m.213637 type:complete len:522 (-) comp33155_c0_seq7:6-1571(-)